MNDAQLISRVIAGDRLAGRELYDAHSPRVYSLVFRLSGDAEKARELTQDTFVRAWEALPQFRGDANITTWLHRIVVNEALIIPDIGALAIPVFEAGAVVCAVSVTNTISHLRCDSRAGIAETLRRAVVDAGFSTEAA